jgi:hypothetical protein
MGHSSSPFTTNAQSSDRVLSHNIDFLFDANPWCAHFSAAHSRVGLVEIENVKMLIERGSRYKCIYLL